MLAQYAAEHRVADEERRDTIVRHLSAFFKDTEIEAVDIEKANGYVAARRSGKIGGGARRANGAGSDATIRRELIVLLTAAKHALKRKRIFAMPVIELPKTAVRDDEEVAFYSREELQRIFDAATGELHHFVRLAYLTGARRGSIENLRRGQVRWDTKRIVLQPEGKVATKKRQPIVPILPSMVPHLQALWDGSVNERLFTRVNFYGPFKDLCKSVGLEGKDHPHLLRHSRISHLLQDGRSLFDVAKFVGDTVATVEKTYGHHSVGWLATIE